MSTKTKIVMTRDLFTKEAVPTSTDALSPQERKFHGLTKPRRFRRKTQTSHLRWV